MFKKIFSLTLAILLCCSTPITVFTQAEHSHIEENDVSVCIDEAAVTNTASLPLETVTEELEAVITDYVLTTSLDSEYLEWLLCAPDEILSATTFELLDYFLKSPFMGQQIFSVSATPADREIDFSCHEAFRELISREDCIEVLESYAGSILYGSEKNELDITKLEKLLAQPSIKSIVSDLPSTASSCPNLQSIYSASEVVTSSVGHYVGSIGGIDYYSAGTISTANERDVEVCTPHRELTPSEVTYINNTFDYVGNIRMNEPTAVYNCHSYAWYQFSNSNPYWIMDISQFLYDSGCTQIAHTSVQTKDIIIYVDGYGYPLHSGVVYGVSSSGEITICSKWGQAGAYLHPIGRVPKEYCSNPSTGEIRCYFFRYHDYENQNTGEEYHSGFYHYFEYADICKICNNQINTTWSRVPCSRPPCAIIKARQKI